MNAWMSAVMRRFSFEPAEILDRFKLWLYQVGVWYLGSAVAHMVMLIVVGLILGTMHLASKKSDAPEFDSSLDTATIDQDLARFKVGDAPLEPTVLDTDSLTQLEPPKIEQTEQINDNSPIFEEKGGGMASDRTDTLGGLGGFDFDKLGDGPVVRGAGGVGVGVGTGDKGGSGGAGEGFGGRGAGMRQAMVGGFGGTRQTERAVAAALNWIARHQNSDGSWGLENFNHHCKDSSCTGLGGVHSDPAATAFGLLPFLAAGQTQDTKGPYQKNIQAGLYWLVKNQRSDGCLATGAAQVMYSHGLASIAVCEAYGLTKDQTLGFCAQQAIKFIEESQDPEGGGWRYAPRQPGDTSVVGWQLMALKSAQMSGLSVNPVTFQKAKHFVESASKGQYHGLFAYTPEAGPSQSMTAVGLLCSQYLGTRRGDPAMIEGMGYLMKNLPRSEQRNNYYWYYATQVMHNLPGPEWDTWNRQMRRILVESQVRQGCATGSWDPEKPTRDAWGQHGGRLMMTSMSALSLEVYYRYLPLYQMGKGEK